MRIGKPARGGQHDSGGSALASAVLAGADFAFAVVDFGWFVGASPRAAACSVAADAGNLNFPNTMSHGYRAISWNRQKRLYDTILVSGVAVYLALFVGVSAVVNPAATVETLLIRGLGTAALVLLHLVLLIGPACRLWPVLLPLLYNRRHLGVTTFLVGLAHGVFALVQFHALGEWSPLVSLWLSNARYGSLANFPFQPLGFLALVILFLMAATSHDFWLKQLSAPVWKRLHLLVYVAYGLLIAHVTLGVLQAETSPWLAGALLLGVTSVSALHGLAAQHERAVDEAPQPKTDFVPVCRIDEIPEGRARIVAVAGERVAVFKFAGQLAALSNVCQHQNGPLGEGRVLDGCVTCPWHGFQYVPSTGAAPAPFTEKVPTFRLRLEGQQIYVETRPQPARTYVEPLRFRETEQSQEAACAN